MTPDSTTFVPSLPTVVATSVVKVKRIARPRSRPRPTSMLSDVRFSLHVTVDELAGLERAVRNADHCLLRRGLWAGLLGSALQGRALRIVPAARRGAGENGLEGCLRARSNGPATPDHPI